MLRWILYNVSYESDMARCNYGVVFSGLLYLFPPVMPTKRQQACSERQYYNKVFAV
jgi:hypothetical protein